MPGMCLVMGMEREVSWGEGPMPEWRRSRGVSTAPAHRMVSLLALRVRLVPEWRVILIPVTVDVESTFIRDTQAFVRTFRFGRFSAPRRIGWIYATLAEERCPVSGL